MPQERARAQRLGAAASGWRPGPLLLLLVGELLGRLERLQQSRILELLAELQRLVEDRLALVGLVCQLLQGDLGLQHGLLLLALPLEGIRQGRMGHAAVADPQRAARRGLGELGRALLPVVLHGGLQEELVAVGAVGERLAEAVVGRVPVLLPQVNQAELGPDVGALVVQESRLAERLVGHVRVVRLVLCVRHAAPGLRCRPELD
mmetsp:Transcript_23085/g.68692  ORF Transcript_23085/g.68692 Transcript_23085/m.68692 type:complete len:205 (-) Transcript_23085:516-1130(-)